MKKAILILTLGLMSSCGGPKKVPEVANAQESDPGYNYRLGILHLNQGNVPSAILALQKCVTVAPQNADAWNALGLAHFMGRQYKEAIAAFSKALEINPALTDVHNNLGNVYSDMTLYDKAKVEYQKVLEDLTYPKPEAAYFNLALIAYAEKDLDKSLNFCRLALNMNPRFARVYNLMGRIYEDKSDPQEAIANYRVGLTVDPEGVELNFSLGEALFRQRQYEEARERFDKVVQVSPTSTQGKRSLEYLQMIKSKKS